MMDSLLDILRSNPVLLLFLTLGIGFFVGKLKFGNFSLGNVTSVLLVAVIIGQIDVELPAALKTVFFMLFLFSIGYNVGPDFFKSLRGSGARQALFAVLMSLMCFGVTVGIAFLFHYSKGETVGLFAGSQTCSSILGVGGEALGRMGLSPEALKKENDIIPVCYAVTYIFGTLGTVIILGNFGPKLLGGTDRVIAQTHELEKKLNASGSMMDPASVNALTTIGYRSFRAHNVFFVTPQTRESVERYLRMNGLEVYIDRVMHNGEIFAPRHDQLIYSGDEIVICGQRDYLVDIPSVIGEETANNALLNYPLDRVGVLVVNKNFIGKTLTTIRTMKFMHGVVIREAKRNNNPLPVEESTIFRKGDRLRIIGRPDQVEYAARHIGHVDRPTIKTDIMFVGLAIFIGGFFGALTLWIGNVPLSFGTSGGSLLAGLIFGWLRSKRPTYGAVSPGALWIMNNLGLNVFIAVVGLDAAPSFVAGLKYVGPMLFVAGAIGTTLPILLGLWMGHKIFKFNPAITLGCCCGTRTCTAALGAVQNALGSPLPAVSYAVTYAVSNILLVIWGLLTVVIV